MAGFGQWLTGLTDEEDDPVNKALRALGLGGEPATETPPASAPAPPEAAQESISGAFWPAAPEPAPAPTFAQGVQSTLERRRAEIEAEPPLDQGPLASELPSRNPLPTLARAGAAGLGVIGRELDPTNPIKLAQNIVQPLPWRAADISQQALDAAYGVVGNEAVEGLGLPNEELVGAELPGVGHVGVRPGDIAGFALGAVADPSNLVGAGPAARAAGAAARAGAGAVEAGARAGAGAVGRHLAENAARVAQLDEAARRAGSTAAPGVFGIAGVTPDTPGVQGMRPRVVPPDVADQLDFPLRPPTDPSIIRAIEAAGGTVDERGVTANVIRNQDPEAAGGIAARGAPFYIMAPPGTRNPTYERAAGAGAEGGTGGSQRVEGQTRFRNPLFISEPPGDRGGFNEAMTALGRGDEERVAAAAEVARLREELGRINRDPARNAEFMPAFERIQEAERRLEAAGRVPDYDTITDEIQQVYRVTPAGSPERTEAIKAMVARYGGDPDLVETLTTMRGPEHEETFYGLRENIVSHQARKAGHDGVITVQQQAPMPDEIYAHPSVKAAVAEQDEIDRRLGQIVRDIDERSATLTEAQRLEDPQVTKLVDEYNQLYQRRDQMLQVLDDAKDQAYRELSTGRITELMDPREARNPTPGTSPEVAAARERLAAANRAMSSAQRAMDEAEGTGWWDTRRAEWEDAARRAAEAQDALDDIGATPGPSATPPGYTLREDIPRRPETRASTIAENPRLAEAEATYNAARDRSLAAHERFQEAEAAHQAQPNAANWRAYQQAERELTEARSAWAPARAAFDAAQEQGRYVTAPATPGLALGPGSDTLAQINADVGSALGSSTFGAAAGAAAPAETDEERRQNALRGAGIGLVAGPAASRLLRSRGGALATPGFGPRATSGLGNVPPSQIREPTLPGMEAPYVRPNLPDISDAPNPGAVRGEDARRGTLPGFESIDPLTDPVRNVPPGERSTTPSQSINDALPAILRTMNEPPPKVKVTDAADEQLTPAQRRAAGQVDLPTESPSFPRRMAATISDVVSPWANRVNIVRYAGMLSDSASQIANIIPSAAMQGVDVATTPIAAALDMARVGAARAVGKQADRQVFMSEVPARLRGMRTGASVGLQAAADVLKTGLRPEDAAKLEQRSGFNSGSGTVDFAFEAPLRALAAADAVFRTTAQGGHLMAEATAAATRANNGKTPTPEMVREAAKDPRVLERAQYLARRTVLQEDRMVTDWYRNAMNYRPSDPIARLSADAARAALSVEVPFVRTPYNVVAQGMGMTPAGLLGTIQDVQQGKAAREVEHRLARVMLGTAVMGAASADYAAGNLTGPYPSDPKEASTLPPGWRAWSRKVQVGGETYYVPLAYAGPLALPPVVAILAGEAQKKGKPAFTPDWAGQIARGVGTYAAQETFIEGIAGIAKLFDERTGEATQARHLEQIAAQFSPHIIGGGALGREIQRVMGMPARDPEGAIEALLATHPATANRVEPRQDVLGRPASLGLGGPAGTVVRAGTERDAGVIRAFRRAGEGLPLQAPKQVPDPTIGGPKTLTPSQRHRWRRAFGSALQEGWDNRGGPEDAESLKKIEADARSVATQTVLGLR